MSPKSIIAAIEQISKTENLQDVIGIIEAEVFGYSLGLSEEKHLEVKVGIPINCMLSRPAMNSAEIPKLLKKFSDEVVAELKYDGERAQVCLFEIN